MKLTSSTEWAIIAALIGYIAFVPGFGVVRELLSSGVGKAVALGLVIYAWKFVSEPIAILLLVAFLRCSSMREGMENMTADMTPNCPKGFKLAEDNTCKNDKGVTGPPPTICLSGQTWNTVTSKCDGASTASTAGIMPTTLEGPTGNTPGLPPMPTMPTGATGPVEGFVPNDSGRKEIYAPA